MKKFIFFAVVFFVFSLTGISQNIAPPILEREITWATQTPEGPAIFEETSLFVGDNQPTNQVQSGEDWWYDCKPLRENGDHVGYIVVGFTTYRNMYFSEHELNPVGFFNQLSPKVGKGNPVASEDDCGRLLNLGETVSQYRQVISRFDLDGKMIWCRPLNYSGPLSSVIQAQDGSIYAIGETRSAYKYGGLQQPEKYIYNPNPNLQPNVPLVDKVHPVDLSNNPHEFGKRRILVYKLDTDGNTQWSYLYGFEDLENPNGDENIQEVNSLKLSNMDMFGVDLSMNSNDDEIIIMGQADDGAPGSPFGYNKYIFTARLNTDGHLINKEILNNGSVNWPKAIACQSGNCVIAGGRQVFGSENDALLYQIDEVNLTTPPGSNWATNPKYMSINAYTSSSVFHDIEFDYQNSSNDDFVVSALSMIHGEGLFGSQYNEGNGKLIRFDDQTTIMQAGNLAICGAYDLRVGITALSDGGFAAVSSFNQGSIDYSASPNYDKLLSYSSSIFPSGCVNSNGLIPDENYWNTDTYVAKFDQNLTMKWETAFDSDDQQPAYVPGDIKKQECMYRISEGDDGRLFVVGNSSHNVDDYFAALLESDCQQDVSYNFPLFQSPQSTETIIGVGSSVTWNSDLKVKGIVRIQNGATLTIQNATIEMANSQHIGVPTKFLVEKGGTLIVNNSTLTCIQGCEAHHLWDGIVVQGDHTINQVSGTGGQGKVILINSTVEFANEAIIPGDYGDYTKNGGIIDATNTIFRNNNRSVQYLTYRNSNCPSCPEYNNLGTFIGCSFIWDNQFPKHSPQPAITMNGVTGVRVKGCIFNDERTNLNPESDRATGIFSIDAGYFVKGINNSGTFSTHPYYNTSGFQIGQFINMHKGIENLSGGSLRPFVVDHVEFINCNRGVIINRTDNAQIIRNRFAFEGNNLLPISKRAAITLIESTSYKVEGNIIENYLTPDVYGTVADNTGIHENMIRKNIYRNLKRGNYALGRNRHLEPSIIEGLQYECNIHENNYIDIKNNSITETDGIRLEQGSNSSATMNALTANPPFGSANIETNDWETMTYFYSGNQPTTMGAILLSQAEEQGCPSSFSDRTSTDRRSQVMDESVINRLSKNQIDPLLSVLLESEGINEKLIPMLISKRSHYGNRAEIIDYHMGIGNLELAQLHLDSLFNELSNYKLEDYRSDMTAFYDFKTYLVNELSTEGSFKNSLSQAQIVQLRGFRDADRGISSQQASNILCFHIGECDDDGELDASSVQNSNDQTISIEDETISFTLYPNPNAGSFNLLGKTSEIKEVTVYDALGSSIPFVINQLSSGTTTIELLNTNSGLYYVKIMDQNKQVHTLRIIVS